MRTRQWARWATCALAISICVPAATADTRGKKSVASCTAFDQTDKDEETLELTIHNSCTIPVDCSLTWRVVCAPEAKKRKQVHAGAARVTISDKTSQVTEASAKVCGDDAWVIDNIVWSCQPNKD